MHVDQEPVDIVAVVSGVVAGRYPVDSHTGLLFIDINDGNT